ncbi:MAG: hypothetical protein K6F79_09955 [Saccharofermentans sp.]|nr:hypothetical protein [Saccharofermentans sp.]
MKRVIALFMSGMMLLSLAACGSAEGGRESRGSRDSREENISDKEIEALQANEGPMLEITCTIQAPIPDDMDRDSTLVLGYNGMIMNPEVDGQTWGPVSDEDYMEIYEFCVDAVENDTYADYYEDVCDGQTYRFVFTDEDGDAHVIYDGYIYDNRALSDVDNLIDSYCGN